MGSFYRRQEEMRLELSNGNWLLVRKHLTAGELREAYQRAAKGGASKPGEPPEIDRGLLAISTAFAYLIDWSITDVQDKPIVIQGQSYDFVRAALDDMTQEGFLEILQAIGAHDAAMTAEREHQKKASAGATEPSPISTSAA